MLTSPTLKLEKILVSVILLIEKLRSLSVPDIALKVYPANL
jgi:hypothetical protein